MKKYAIILLSLFCYSAHAGRIHEAARKGNITQIYHAVALGDNINAPQGYRYLTPLHCAVESGCEQSVEILCQFTMTNRNARTVMGLTPLHFAVRNKNVAIARILLKHGANVDSEWGVNGDRGTSLHEAVKNNDAQMVALLLEYGAEPFVECVVPYRTVDAHKALGRRGVCRNAFQLAQKSNVCQEIRDLLKRDYKMDIS